MIGVEIVRNKMTRQEAPDLRDQVIKMAFQRGLLLLSAGTSSLRLSPPLTISRDQADFAIDTLEDCLGRL
jgi:4-aminobutyrate aminotransferase